MHCNPGFCCNAAPCIGPLLNFEMCMQEEVGVSPVTEAITAAVHQSGGRALGGRATFIPLLERCRTETTLQVARFPHPQLPSLRAQLSVPQLRFFISPARIRRVLRVLRTAMPGTKGLLKRRASTESHLHCYEVPLEIQGWPYISERCAMSV